MAEMQIPSFLEEQDLDEIHARMMMNLPEDMDTSEGSHPWNLTMPAAYEKAYMAEFVLTEAIKLIFPMFCEDYPEIMEYHAQTRGLTRKEAQYAEGEIVVTADEGTEIPADSMFSTMGMNGESSVDFLTTEDVIVEAGQTTVTIPIRAMYAGIIGNVPADTIVLNASSIEGISDVTNPVATDGGLEEETVEALQARIMEYDMSNEYAYGGSETDYKRWALSVPGTGGAVVVAPEDDTTPITIVVTDSQGFPADTALCKDVYNYIMRPDNPEERLAPINDHLQVVPPSTVNLIITATVEIEPGTSLTQIKDLFVAGLKKYALEAADVGEIRYTKVGAVLSDIAGVNDYASLTVNGGTSNIALTDSQVPFVDASRITLTSGTV